MISYVDHQLYIRGQANAESPPAFISAVLWTALEIQLFSTRQHRLWQITPQRID